MTLLGTGWLASDQGAPDTLSGVFVPTWSALERAPFPTRRSEFRFVMNSLYDLPRGKVLDAGAGFNPEIHVMPAILAAMGFQVTAVDAEVASLSMPHNDRIVRHVDDITDLPYKNAAFDYWVCVSVLEHLSTGDRALALSQAHRILKPGGLLIITMDEEDPELLNTLLTCCAFQAGSVTDFSGNHLSPQVSWAVAKKSL